MAYYTEAAEGQPFCCRTEGSVQGKNGPVPYHLDLEEIRLEEEGKIYASIGCFSYLKDREEENALRPVLFIFNGGPGANSMWLHLGFYGPMIIRMGENGLPFTDEEGSLRENDACLLDLCDLVFYDPANAGFSRLNDPEAALKVYGDHADAKTAAAFVKAWLKKHKREKSTVFVSGESFGATRASLMGWYLADEVKIGGLIYIGPGYSCTEDLKRTFKDFMSTACSNWYYLKKENASEAAFWPLEKWKEEARNFLEQSYLRAIYMGNLLSGEERTEIAGKLAYFTGLSKEYYLEHGLICSRADFCRMRRSRYGEKLGSYDTRFSLPAEDPRDPFTAAFDPAIEAGRKWYFTKLAELPGREYREGTFREEEEFYWSFDASPSMMELTHVYVPVEVSLSDAVALLHKKQPEAKLFFAAGCYDTVANIEGVRYSTAHTDIPAECVIRKEYESGHAVYADEISRRKLAADIREFIEMQV